MQWQDSYNESLTAYTNNIPQRDGGTHVTGLRGAMTRVLKNYIAKNELAKKSKVDPDGDDMREGLTCVLSVKIPQPKFSSQTKDKLVSSEVRPAVEDVVSRELELYLEQNPTDAKLICEKLLRQLEHVKPHERHATLLAKQVWAADFQANSLTVEKRILRTPSFSW